MPFVAAAIMIPVMLITMMGTMSGGNIFTTALLCGAVGAVLVLMIALIRLPLRKNVNRRSRRMEQVADLGPRSAEVTVHPARPGASIQIEPGRWLRINLFPDRALGRWSDEIRAEFDRMMRCVAKRGSQGHWVGIYRK